eukprot:1870539-Rhodomonas_salina.2
MLPKQFQDVKSGRYIVVVQNMWYKREDASNLQAFRESDERCPVTFVGGESEHFDKYLKVAFCSSLFELALDIEWHGAGLTTRIVLVYLGIRRAARANSDRVGQPSHQGPDASGRFAVLC